MMKDLQDLVKLSNFLGSNKDYVIAGGGNTSYKNDTYLWIKPSGVELATIEQNDFIVLERHKIQQVFWKDYNSDPEEREKQIKNDLLRSKTNPEQILRPSVETTLHEMLDYRFIAHTHPYIINAILCSQQAHQKTVELFGEEVLFIDYTDPGYTLSKKAELLIQDYKKKHKKEPNIIFIENHGVIVAADHVHEIYTLYNYIFDKIKQKFRAEAEMDSYEVNPIMKHVLPAVRMIYSTDSTKIVRIRNNKLVSYFNENQERFNRINGAFTPDHIVYCKRRPIYIECELEANTIIERIKEETTRYRDEYHSDPKAIFIKFIGLIVIGDSSRSADIVYDLMMDAMKISFYSDNFGGPQFMSERDVDFIDNWDAEAYRKKMAANNISTADKANKIAIVTGGAQGFGGGIVDSFYKDGLNVVIADLNEQIGSEKAAELNNPKKANKAIFVKTDVSNAESVSNLIFETVKEFGGLDVFISNAGILRAGGLDEMEVSTFNLMTNVNYTAYFICAKYASEVLKIQHQYKPRYYTDIIQINSKSGLKGSNKNFAYAGGKFGGIGLTQSFAMELMPYCIKVNSICPGNFFEGPLWSDPEKGLFVQYLNAGKVPGATSIEDVKKFYEAQVPAGRGCYVEDVLKAIYYIMSQEYETGQAVPVTGGQNMLK